MRFIPIFLLLSSCGAIHDCSVLPGLTQDIEYPQDKTIDAASVITDPLHNISMVAECQLL